MSRSMLGLATADQRPNLHYPITDSKTNTTYDAPEARGWRYSKDRMQSLIDTDCVIFPSLPTGRPREKKYIADLQSEYIAFPTIIDDVHTSDGTDEVRKLFGSQLFDFPKPSELLRRLVEQIASADDLVVDLFAGSSSTAHAVIKQNLRDNGHRKFIMVQLPEATKEKTEAEKAGFQNIAQLSRERIRRTILAQQNDTSENAFEDSAQLGFKAFSLSSSGFRLWQGEADVLNDELDLHIENVDKAATPEDIVYELLLKSGFSLTTKVETVKMAGKDVFSIENGSLLICLDKEITPELIDAMAEADPLQVICLDEGFKGNDQLKTNAVQTFKSRAASRETEIVFRTV